MPASRKITRQQTTATGVRPGVSQDLGKGGRKAFKELTLLKTKVAADERNGVEQVDSKGLPALQKIRLLERRVKASRKAVKKNAAKSLRQRSKCAIEAGELKWLYNDSDTFQPGPMSPRGTRSNTNKHDQLGGVDQKPNVPEAGGRVVAVEDHSQAQAVVDRMADTSYEPNPLDAFYDAFLGESP